MPPLDTLEPWSRTHAEAITFAVFFGLFAVLAAAELVVSRSPTPADRVRRWSTNAVLTAGWVAAGAAVPMTLFGAAESARDAGWGLLNQFDLSTLTAVGLGIVARSLVSYSVHVAMHKIPFL